MDAGDCPELAGSRDNEIAIPAVELRRAFLGDIPIFLFSLFGGVIADRMDRRHLLIGSQLVQMCSAITLAVLIATDNIKVWHILLSSFVVGTAQSFGVVRPTSALVPSLVEKEDLPNAIALNSIQFNLARVIGPVLGGLALKYVGGRHGASASTTLSVRGSDRVAATQVTRSTSSRRIPANRS